MAVRRRGAYQLRLGARQLVDLDVDALILLILAHRYAGQVEALGHCERRKDQACPHCGPPMRRVTCVTCHTGQLRGKVMIVAVGALVCSKKSYANWSTTSLCKEDLLPRGVTVISSRISSCSKAYRPVAELAICEVQTQLFETGSQNRYRSFQPKV